MPMTFKYKLATRNCVPPDEMFDDKQTLLMETFLKRRDKAKAPDDERKIVGRLFDRARTHGFEANGFTPYGQINWVGIAEDTPGTHPKKEWDPRGVGTIATVVKCSKCRVEFRYEHYEMDEPMQYCYRCAEYYEGREMASVSP